MMDDDTARQLWDETLRQNILVLCKTPMAVSITRRTLAGFRPADVNARDYPNLIQELIDKPAHVADILHDTQHFWHLNNPLLKIDAVIGNPPYQVMVEGNGRSKPVYHLLMDLSFAIAQRSTLITPARYLFNTGFTPTEWNLKMLNDEHFRIVLYRANSSDLFPNVDIKGGIAIMYRDAGHRFRKIGVFKAYPELENIMQKVASHMPSSLTEIIYAESSYSFNMKNDEAALIVKERLGNDKKIITNVFEKLPDLFTTESRENAIGFYGRTNKGGRCIRYVSRELIVAHPNLDKYKVLVPEGNGSGAIGEISSTPIIGDPFIGEPHLGATQTFLTIGAFDTKAEAEACLKYVKTKFARTMLGILKVTQHNPKDTWQYVPMQDFTAASDIDWSQSVAAIDQQLYRKYALSQEEIAFIEKMIKPMV